MGNNSSSAGLEHLRVTADGAARARKLRVGAEDLLLDARDALEGLGVCTAGLRDTAETPLAAAAALSSFFEAYLASAERAQARSVVQGMGRWLERMRAHAEEEARKSRAARKM